MRVIVSEIGRVGGVGGRIRDGTVYGVGRGGLGVVIRSRGENSRWKMAFQVVVRLYGCDLIGGRVWEVEVDVQNRERFFSIIYKTRTRRERRGGRDCESVGFSA